MSLFTWFRRGLQRVTEWLLPSAELSITDSVDSFIDGITGQRAKVNSNVRAKKACLSKAIAALTAAEQSLERRMFSQPDSDFLTHLLDKGRQLLFIQSRDFPSRDELLAFCSQVERSARRDYGIAGSRQQFRALSTSAHRLRQALALYPALRRLFNTINQGVEWHALPQLQADFLRLQRLFNKEQLSRFFYAPQNNHPLSNSAWQQLSKQTADALHLLHFVQPIFNEFERRLSGASSEAELPSIAKLTQWRLMITQRINKAKKQPKGMQISKVNSPLIAFIEKKAALLSERLAAKLVKQATQRDNLTFKLARLANQLADFAETIDATLCCDEPLLPVVNQLTCRYDMVQVYAKWLSEKQTQQSLTAHWPSLATVSSTPERRITRFYSSIHAALDTLSLAIARALRGGTSPYLSIKQQLDAFSQLALCTDATRYQLQLKQFQRQLFFYSHQQLTDNAHFSFLRRSFWTGKDSSLCDWHSIVAHARGANSGFFGYSGNRSKKVLAHLGFIDSQGNATIDAPWYQLPRFK